jgi:hypothetical protein
MSKYDPTPSNKFRAPSSDGAQRARRLCALERRPPHGHPGDAVYAHGLRTATSANWKSWILRVTNVKSCSIANAAIMESTAGGLTPLSSLRPTRRPHRSATAASNGTMRPENRSAVAAIKASNFAFRNGHTTFSIPFRISPIVRTLRWNVTSSPASAQETTRGSDRVPFASSEMTFVSSRKPLKILRRVRRRLGFARADRVPRAENSQKTQRSMCRRSESAARSRAATVSRQLVVHASLSVGVPQTALGTRLH